MMILKCINVITISIGRTKDFIKNVVAYNKFKKDLYETYIEEYLQIKEQNDKRIMDEENRKQIDATKPTQKEVVLSEKCVLCISLRSVRDVRGEGSFKENGSFIINQGFKEKLDELQKQKDFEFE